MRVLIGPDRLSGADGVDEEGLAELYAVPATPWLRVNMVSTVDGSATGESGVTGTINNAADKRVFHALRRFADVIVVGAGTARTERYRPADRPIVVVSRRADVPETLRGAAPGQVLMATVAGAERLERPVPCSAPRTSSCSARTASTWPSSSPGWPPAAGCTSSPRAARTCCATWSTRARPTSCAPRSCRAWSPAPTRGSPTARRSTYPSSWRCCSRRTAPCSAAGWWITGPGSRARAHEELLRDPGQRSHVPWLPPCCRWRRSAVTTPAARRCPAAWSSAWHGSAPGGSRRPASRPPRSRSPPARCCRSRAARPRARRCPTR